jgi:hypothetical protein
MLSAMVLLAGCQTPNTEKGSAQATAQKPCAKPAEKIAPCPAAAKVEDIIIDNADPGFRSEGSWDPGASEKNYKDGVVWAAGGDQATAKAVWSPDIKIPGTYEVYEWHGEDTNSDHASDAPFTINYQGSSATVRVNFRENVGKWNPLGEYKFAAGTTGNVTLTNKVSGNVIADAVKFVYKGK